MDEMKQGEGTVLWVEAPFNVITVPAPISVSPPPEDATDEQLLDFGAACGAGALYQHTTRRVVLAYLRKWHPEHEALKP